MRSIICQNTRTKLKNNTKILCENSDFSNNSPQMKKYFHSQDVSARKVGKIFISKYPTGKVKMRQWRDSTGWGMLRASVVIEGWQWHWQRGVHILRTCRTMSLSFHIDRWHYALWCCNVGALCLYQAYECVTVPCLRLPVIVNMTTWYPVAISPL